MVLRFKKLEGKSLTKTLLIVAGTLLLILVVGVSYMALTFKPQQVRVTNITDRSATVSWQTSKPTVGVVRYRGTDGSRGVAYDDRDYSKAEMEMATSDPESYMSDDFEVKVSNKGKYYTHHVTLHGLEPEVEYSFRIGNGLFSKANVQFASGELESFTAVTEPRFSTKPELESVLNPNPTYGNVTTAYGAVINDAIAYMSSVKDGETVTLSAPLNEEGKWYLDLTTARKSDGQIVLFNDAVDKQTMKVETVGMSSGLHSIDMRYNAPAPNIVMEIVEEELVLGIASLVYAGVDNCCGQSDYRGGAACESEEDWINGYNACQAKSCAACSDDPAQCISDGNPCNRNDGCCSKICASGRCGLAAQEDHTNPQATGGNDVSEGARCSGCAGQYPEAGCPNGYVTNTAYKNGDIACKKICADGTWVWTNSCSPDFVDNPAPLHTAQTCYPPKCLAHEKDCWGHNSCWGIHCCTNGYLEKREHNSETFAEQRVSNQIQCYYRHDWGCLSELQEAESCSTEESKGVIVTDHALQCPRVIRLETDIDGDGLFVGGGEVSRNSRACTLYSGEGENSFTRMYNPDTHDCVEGVITPKDSNGADDKVEAGEEDGSESTNIACVLWRYSTSEPCDKLCEEVRVGFKPTPQNSTCEQYSSNSWSEPVYNTMTECNQARVTHCNERTREELPSPLDFSDDVSPSLPSLLKPSPASAQEQDNIASVQYSGDYILIPQESGVYNLTIPGAKPQEITMEAGQEYTFYIDYNDNGQRDEGEMVNLSEGNVTINYIDEKIGSELQLKKGINMVSFNNLPSNMDSCELIKEMNNSYNKDLEETKFVSQIARFVGSKFEVTSFRPDLDQETGGECFPVRPGEGYVMRAHEEMKVLFAGYRLANAAPIKINQPGWSMIGVNGSGENWTAVKLIDRFNSDERFLVNNLSRWRTEASMYQGLQKDKKEAGDEYDTFGFDFPLRSSEGYFLRVVEGAGVLEIE